MSRTLSPCLGIAPPVSTGLGRRPLLTRADVLFCMLPIALFLSIVSLV